MTSKAKSNAQAKKYYRHKCPRHSDLTILLNSANKPLCNSCFATLKKSYFNVIAGTLLEMQYLHNLTRGLLEQNNSLQNQIQDQQLHLLNLTHEIAEIKNSEGHYENSRPEAPHHTIPEEANTPGQTEETGSAPVPSAGHVPKARLLLSKLTQARIKRFIALGTKKNARTRPKSDDLQDRSTFTPINSTRSTGQIISKLQDRK